MKVRLSSSAGSASIKMAAITSRGLAGPSPCLLCLIRAMARSLNWAADCSTWQVGYRRERLPRPPWIAGRSRDLDLLVDHVAVAELIHGLRGAVVSDEARWDRGDVRAVRRALAVVHGVEIEILEGVEAVGPAGDVVVATPDLDHLA